MQDERDDLLEEIERTVSDVSDDEMDMDAAIGRVQELIERARAMGVVRYPRP